MVQGNSSILLQCLFLFLLAVMALMYASVGHGGASGYLAVLALFSVDPAIMKSSALLLNIFVSLISFWQYYRGGYFHWKLFLPFALTSIPASYLGASIPLGADIYKKILGICLLFPILRLAGLLGKEHDTTTPMKWLPALAIGGLIGFLSGMIGIGGGIILSPVILLLHWAKMKETAAISALFILVNSISGFSALFVRGFSPNPEIYGWLAAAIAGGFAGAYLGSRKLGSRPLRYILAGVLLIASIKLLMT